MRAIIIAGLLAVAAVVGGSVPVAAATRPEAGLASVRTRPAAPPAAQPSTPPTEISCGSMRSCLVVGSNYTLNGTPSGPAISRTTALAWNGSRWRTVAVPVPKGAKGAELLQASCRSATFCVAVGDYVTNAATDDTRFYAATWNGSALRPTAALPLPKGDAFAVLQAVSCVTARDCVALGSASNRAGGNVNLAERWNGATWTMRAQPAAIGRDHLELSSIACLSGAYCEVAGQLVPPNSDKFGLYVGSWNGRSLARQQAPLPAGAHMGLVNDLSCATRDLCAVAGLSQLTGSRADSFTETWNGRAWTATPLAVRKGAPFSFLWGVACPDVRLCVSVGSIGSAFFSPSAPQALAYNGKTWSRQAVPDVKRGEAEFASVSCPSPRLCVAIGTSEASASAAPAPLAGFWNGKTWRLAAA